MNKNILSLLLLCGTIFGSVAIGAPSRYQEISSNMGGIGLDGLPQLSFDFLDRADIDDLARLGVRFKLVHHVKLRHGRTAKSEWSLPNLLTYASVDDQGNVIWLPPGGRIAYFQRNKDGNREGPNGAFAIVRESGTVIEIITQFNRTFRYRNGCLETIRGQQETYLFVTNHAKIISISKLMKNRITPLLTVTHTPLGKLDTLTFGDGANYKFFWAPGNLLSTVEKQGKTIFAFEYTDSLLRLLKRHDGTHNMFKWLSYDRIRSTVFQVPPVLLCEDSFYRYDWKLNRSIRSVCIYDKLGGFISKTSIGTAGINQITQTKVISYSFNEQALKTDPVTGIEN